MRQTFRTLWACLLMALLPAPAFAWGGVGHRLITRRAIDLLPPELKPFFVANRDEIIVRAIDPDLWRAAGWAEHPNHFLDFGAAEYGAFPFPDLPRDYGAALERFGRATLERNGLLPWRQAEMFGHLRRVFEGFRRPSPYGTYEAILFSAALSHYVQDSHQPFHATDNYDGQRTGQRGIHARFETSLVERFESRITLNPAVPAAITTPRDFAFDALLASHQLVDAILRADKRAVTGKETYDDEYYETFFASVKAVLERRLSEAITATAGLIMGAWEQSGRPAIPLKEPRPIEKVSR